MAFDTESSTIWGKFKSSTSNLHSSQEKAPKYKPTKDHFSDSKKGLKSKLALNSSDSSSSKRKDAYYVEKDGDDIDSTVVHKALVKHYKNKRKNDPKGFEGFPSWLGYKETEEDIIMQREQQRELAPKPEKKIEQKEPEVKDPSTLQSGYKPLSSRPLFKATHSSMRNLNINDTQNDFNNEIMQSNSEPPSGNAPKKAYSMRDRMKRR